MIARLPAARIARSRSRSSGRQTVGLILELELCDNATPSANGRTGRRSMKQAKDRKAEDATCQRQSRPNPVMEPNPHQTISNRSAEVNRCIQSDVHDRARQRAGDTLWTAWIRDRTIPPQGVDVVRLDAGNHVVRAGHDDRRADSREGGNLICHASRHPGLGPNQHERPNDGHHPSRTSSASCHGRTTRTGRPSSPIRPRSARRRCPRTG